jgi:membrane protease YdiL (CAAX protease family)
VLSQLPGLAVPTTFPAPFDPLAPFALPPNAYLGTPLEGAAWLALLALGGWLANIAGEELFWRGWLLPRQQGLWGRWAWLPHGLGWLLLVHAFMPWAWPSLLPTTLLVPWLSQRTGSIWTAVVVHGTGNGAYAALVAIAALG